MPAAVGFALFLILRESSDWAVATVDPDLNMITTHSPGTTTISAACKDSGLQSNSVVLEVLDINSIDLSPTEVEVRAGSRQPITATIHTRDGRHWEGGYLVWTEDNREIISVGSSGMVFALTPGRSTVVAGDNQTIASTPTQVTVIEADEQGKDGGSGFPQILLSEIDQDPFGEEAPTFSQAEPPVHQRPQDVDHNIWWINMASPLARRYFSNRARSKEWRVYHLERYIEIMVKIVLSYDLLQGEDISFETMLRRWDEEFYHYAEERRRKLSALLGRWGHRASTASAMTKKLTLPEKLLLASLEVRKKSATFTAEDLIVQAWKLYPDTFGLSGYGHLYPRLKSGSHQDHGDGGYAGQGLAP